MTLLRFDEVRCRQGINNTQRIKLSEESRVCRSTLLRMGRDHIEIGGGLGGRKQRGSDIDVGLEKTIVEEGFVVHIEAAEVIQCEAEQTP